MSTKYLKMFNTHAEYEAYINGPDKLLPNVSHCKNNNDVHYNPYHQPIVVKLNVTSTDSATTICYSTSSFSEMEIDGVVQPNVVQEYTFETTGEHTVKYTLLDPTSIGDYAFYDCTSLASITIPSTVTSIGNKSFAGCTSLTSITIPSSVTSIGEFAFQNCTGLTSITIPSGVTSIGEGAFADCSGLTSIEIPSSVTSISGFAFADCRDLYSITSQATTAPTIQTTTFQNVKTGGTLYVPSGSTGYDVWMGTGNFYLGQYNWTKVEQ